MKFPRLILIGCSLLGLMFAQEGVQQSGSSEDTTPPPPATGLSLQALREAEKKIIAERQTLLQREERIRLLSEEIRNNAENVRVKEQIYLENLQRFRDEVEALAQQRLLPEIPAELVAYYESRDPAVAASDFKVLYGQTPKVAVALIKNMKKRKSALLIDEISKTGEDGKRIAAEIAGAIGEDY